MYVHVYVLYNTYPGTRVGVHVYVLEYTVYCNTRVLQYCSPSSCVYTRVLQYCNTRAHAYRYEYVYVVSLVCTRVQYTCTGMAYTGIPVLQYRPVHPSTRVLLQYTRTRVLRTRVAATGTGTRVPVVRYSYGHIAILHTGIKCPYGSPPWYEYTYV